MLENRRKWMFQVYKRTTKPSLHVFCSIHMISNRFDDADLCWQAHSLLSQMLISFRSTFTNTPRNNILPSIWVSIPQPSQVGTKLSMTPNLGYLEMSSILFFFTFCLIKISFSCTFTSFSCLFFCNSFLVKLSGKRTNSYFLDDLQDLLNCHFCFLSFSSLTVTVRDSIRSS